MTLAEGSAGSAFARQASSPDTNVAAELGFAQGFETQGLLVDEDETLGCARAEVLVDRALSLLEEQRDEPYFLYLHATDPHDLLRRRIPGPELTPLPAAIDEISRRRLEALAYVR